jgi:fatty acid desaturase
VEGNLPGDLSSTMKYQRDSLMHWLRYFLRFFFFCAIELPIYHVKKNRPKLARRTVLGEYSFLIGCAAGLYLRPLPTLFVFVIPFVLIRFLMMAGNWGQHAFVDPVEADNDFKSSITCINVRYNTRCFNDGYHIIHHLKPALHYTEMDKEFEANREKYGAQDAIVFSGIDFFGVWVMLMLGRYKTLAKAFVQLPGAPERSEAEIIALFKHRLAPIRGWQPAKAAARQSNSAGAPAAV